MAREAYLGDRLIFIISQPRSGSTLLQRVLAGHPDIHTSAETWLMLQPLYALKDDGYRSEYNEQWAGEAVAEFLEHYTDGPDVYDDAIRAFARVLYENALARTGKHFFLDKTPRYYYVIPELYRIFPRAQFIFLLRNPLAVLASELASYVGGKYTELAQFHDDLLLAPQRILDGIDELGERATIVRYEQFVAHPDDTVAALCASLGLSFDADMLDYSTTPMPLGKMNDHIGIVRHTKPSPASAEKWKRLATDAQSRHFAHSYLNALGQPLIERLGYSFDELSTVLGEAVPASARSNVFPWDIAIRPEHHWTLRDRYFVDRLTGIKRRGPLLGELAGAKRTLRRAFESTSRAVRPGTANSAGEANGTVEKDDIQNGATQKKTRRR